MTISIRRNYYVDQFGWANGQLLLGRWRIVFKRYA